jgi:ribosome-binding factor A
MGRKYRQRISELIQFHLTSLLERKVKDPRVEMVTITDVQVTGDASRADVHFSVLGGEEERAEAKGGLKSASGWLRRELGNRLDLRNTPELIFHYDPSLKRGERIANILDDLGLGDEADEETEEE